MTHIDLVQTQNILRQQANWPAKKLRRQVTGALLFLLIAAGYALFHASAKSATEGSSAPLPVMVKSVHPRTTKEYFGYRNAVNYREIAPHVAGRLTKTSLHLERRLAAEGWLL